MFTNYGDRNFFEYGLLVEPVSDTEFRLLVCNPYSDSDDLYQFACICVDTKDSWIDKEKVNDYNGEPIEDPLQLAIAAYSYYGPEEFGAYSMSYDWQHMTRDQILEELKHYGVSASEDICLDAD